MNLALICFLGTDCDLVLRKYTEWFISGFDIGLKNHYTVYMHEQTILDNPVSLEVDLVHIVFSDKSLFRVESTINSFLNTKTDTNMDMDVFPKSAKFSFTCIQNGRKNKQFTSMELTDRLSTQLGSGRFNGCSCWSLCFDWSKQKERLIKLIQYRKVCDRIENEGLHLGITGRVKAVDVSSNQVETYRGSTVISE